MNYQKLEDLLIETEYDEEKTKFLVNGFKHGFDLGYRGPEKIQQTSKNLKFTIGNKEELWNKVMKEVQQKRYAGPFKTIPFKNYIQSPIGLVPKDGGKKTRLIFHLSHPRNEEFGISVNAATPQHLAKVSYPKFDDAVRQCLREGKGCSAGKSDMSSAFRHFAIKKKYWKYLVMKAQNPIDGKTYYFVDKCMPFGASISCANFQAFSDAISHIVEYKIKKWNTNYLDDFFFTDAAKENCDNQIKCFIDICSSINFPVSMEKTFWGTTRISFLGLLIDTILQMIFIPIEKVERALTTIRYIINKKNKKIKMKTLQKLTGFLNFLGKSIVPGRAFTRRLYSYVKSDMKPDHHLYVKQEMKLDLEMWQVFLENPGIYSRQFLEFDREFTSEDINMYTDATANPNLGCGGIGDNEWFITQWDEDFILENDPSINYLELYAVTVAVCLWIYKHKNKCITLFCDNMSVVHMINNTSSNCKNCMVLIRIIVLLGLVHNVRISAKHVLGKNNQFSDLLSRLKYKEFKTLARQKKSTFKNRPTKLPEMLWPMDKLWLTYN